jgi:site-specific recombinase XerD
MEQRGERENRWGHRDATAILLAYRHGLHASELVALPWDDISLQAGKLMVGVEARPATT